MEIKYQKHKARKNRKMELMLRVVTDYNGGIPAVEIAKRYGITRAWVYTLLKQASDTIINSEK